MILGSKGKKNKILFLRGNLVILTLGFLIGVDNFYIGPLKRQVFFIFNF